MISNILKENIKIYNIKDSIFSITCNKNIMPFKAKINLLFNIFGNSYFPCNMYIRHKYNYCYNQRVINDKSLAEKFLKFYLKIEKNFLILDYGCGEGRIIGLLNQLGYKNIVGQDISFFKIWKRYDGTFLITPIRCKEFYPYKDKIFDIVFSIQVIMYLNDEQLVQHIENIARILEENGCFILEYRNDNMINPKNFTKNECCPYIHSRTRIIELLEKNNFEILREETYGIDVKYLSKYIKWLRNFIVSKRKYDVFDFYEKSWFGRLLKNFLPKGKELLILLICRKK